MKFIEQVIPFPFKNVQEYKENETSFADICRNISDVVDKNTANLKTELYNYRRLPCIGIGGMQYQSIQGDVNEYYTRGSIGIYLTWLKQMPYVVSVFVPDEFEPFEQEIKQIVKYKLRFPIQLIKTIIYINNTIVSNSTKEEISVDDKYNIIFKSNENPNPQS